MRKITYLAGLPRSGSTILSNVLGMHPSIYSTPSSPLCNIVMQMRRQWSDDPFLLSQLDNNFEDVNNRLKRSTRAFMSAWSMNDKHDKIDDENTSLITIDKNRGWLFLLETLRELDPNFQIIVTVRKLEDVYRSVEKRHRKTLMLEFPDHMEHNIVDARANALFADGGIVGGPLKAIQNISDIPSISKHIYYWRFEDFLKKPQETTSHMFKWLGVENKEIDFSNIEQSTKESDSWYRMKYLHKVSKNVVVPEENTPISPRIEAEIKRRFAWYDKMFYPEFVQQENNTTQTTNIVDPDIKAKAQELEKMIDKEISKK